MAQPQSRSGLYHTATNAAVLGLVTNLLLSAVKLAGGLVGHSFALVADAANSLGDVLVSAVVIYALRVSQRPADAEHPYGYSKAETIAGSNVALFMVLSALALGWEAIQRLTVAHEPPPIWTLWIAAGNVIIKETLYRYKTRIGKRTGSMAILANAWDHRSDALCSLAVFIGLSIVRYAGPAYIFADECAALVVVAAIVWSGVKLFRETAGELMDTQADTDLVAEVRAVANAVPGVHDIEKLWVRKGGLEYHVDIHIHVDPLMTVEEGHRIGHAVKDRLLEHFVVVRDVLVHLEPMSR